MNKRSLMVGLSGLLGLSLCSGVFGFISNNEAKEANATSSTATYTVKSTTSVTTSGVAPKGSVATFKNTYTNTIDQMTAKNSMTLTLSGYNGCTIKAITLSMHSNASKGAGTFSVVAGSTTLAEISSATNFNKWYNNTSNGIDYRDVNVTLTNNSYEIKEKENLVITIAATTNSLYCKSFSITYEEDSKPVYATGITIVSDLGDNTLYDTSSEVKITPTFDPAGYNGDITYEFTDSSMNDFASIKGNDDLTCTLTPIKAGSVSVIAKANSSETETISSNVLTFEIVEDTPASIKLTGQNNSFNDGDTFSYGKNAKATVTNVSGLTKQIDTSLLTAKLDGKEINESTTLTTEDNGKEVTVSYEGVSTSYTITVLGKATYSYEFEKVPSVGLNNLNGIEWYLSLPSSTRIAKDTNGRGIQFGTSNSPIKELGIYSEPFIASSKETQIKKILVNSSTASKGKAALEVLVNGKQIGDKVNLTSTATTYIFALENESNGIVEIRITNSTSTAVYIKSIEINAEKDDGTNVILNSIAKDISSIKTCSVEGESKDFENFLATSTELGTYEEVIGSYQNELSSLMILDYSYEDYSSNKKSYTNIDKSIYISVMEKYNALEARYLSSTKVANGISTSSSNNSIAIAATASLIGILAFSLLMISKKKKA